MVVEPMPCQDELRSALSVSAPRDATPARSDLSGFARLAAEALLLGGPLAAFASLAVCVLAAVLVPVGLWRPAVVLPLLVLAASAVWLLLRAVRRCLLLVGAPVAARAPVWAAAASLAIAIAFGAWAGLTHGEHLIIRRDAGSYALFGHWLATRHGLPVGPSLDAFGGAAALGVPGFTLASPAFFQVATLGGAEVVPQFLLGAPALFSLGWWLNGWTGLFTVSAVVGGFAILAAAGLTARLAGPQWAPVGAAALAVTQPALHAARATLSEPLALLLVLAAAALAVDAVDRAPDAPGTRRLATAAGAVLGLAGLVRVDVLREVAVVIPVCALLALRRHRAGIPLAVAALASSALVAIPDVMLSRPYLESVAASLRPLVAGTLALTVVSAAALLIGFGHGARAGRKASAGARPSAMTAAVVRWLPAAAAAAVLLVGVALATRPLWSTVRQSAADPAVPLIASLQRQQGLPVDGARTYAERSVEWLTWYIGPVTAVMALIAVAVGAARAVAWLTGDAGRRPPAWLLPSVAGFASTVLTLYRPGITPDHPWADRRLVPVALPFTVIAATVAAAWAVRAGRRRFRRFSAAPAWGAAVAVAVAVLVVPAAMATWPLVNRRTEVGQPRAAATVCAALRPGDAVVAVSDSSGGIRAQNEWVQVVRGVCGHPSAALVAPAVDRPAGLARLARLVEGAGGRLVLLSAGEDDGTAARSLTELGLEPRRAARLRTTEDQRLLTRRPDALDSMMIDVWLATWRDPAGG